MNKSKNVNLQKLIEKNYEAMKDKTYEWSDDEVQAVYNLVGDYIKKKKFKNTGEKEDFVQKLAFLTTSKYIKGYNLESGVKISTFLNKCYENEYNMFMRRSNTRLNLNTFSLDEPVKNIHKLKDGDIIERIEMIKDIHTQYDNYVMNSWTNFLNEEYDKSYFLKDVVLNGQTQSALAKKYGVNQTHVRRWIVMEKDIIFLRVVNKRIPVPEKYNAEFESAIDNINNKILKDPILKKYNTTQKLEEYYSKRVNRAAVRYGIIESPVEQVVSRAKQNKAKTTNDTKEEVTR